MCQTPALPTAVICQGCGYNFRTGARTPGVGPAGTRGRPAALQYAQPDQGRFSADTYRQAAKASWALPLVMIVFGCCTRGAVRSSPELGLLVGVFQLLLMLSAVGLGIFALIGARRHGSEGIVLPAVVGLCLNAAIIVLNIVLFTMLIGGALTPPTAPPPGGGTAPTNAQPGGGRGF